MTLVYKYGLLPPVANADTVERQILLGHRYQNGLVEIERSHRERYCDERRRLFPEFEALETEVATLSERITAINEMFASNAAPPGSLDEKARLKRERKDAGKRLSAEKKRLRWSDELKVVAADLNESRAAAKRALRASYNDDGLYWGTYLARENAHSTATRTSNPRFQRWTGDGYIAVQIQRSAIDKRVGIDVGDLDDERSTMVRVSSLPADQWDTRSGRRHAYTTLRVRIGSAGRAPIWAEFPMLQHRPFPSGARVKWVRINRRRVGRRFKWSVDFTLDTSDCVVLASRRGRGTAGVDVGWRRTEDGIRIAVLSDGENTEEVVLPSSIEYRARKAADIESIRDRAFNDIKSELAAVEPRPEALSGVGATRSKSRLRRVIASWESGTPLSMRAREWAYHDRHLEDYAAGCRSRATAARKEFFRLTARRWRATYGSIGIERLPVAKLTRRAEPGEREGEPGQGARRQRTVAAPGLLLAEIRVVFGDDAVVVNPAYTSKRCASCGEISDWADPVAVVQTCGFCGQSFDRDENAAKNIRNLALGVASGEVAR